MDELVKLCLRQCGDDFEEEIRMHIKTCLSELDMWGLCNLYKETQNGTEYEPQVQNAVVAFCKWRFGDSETKDDWERIYHTIVGQMLLSSKFKE